MTEQVELFPLYLITDRHQAVPDLPHALEQALRGGARLVQLRDKDLPPAERLQLAKELRQLTRRFDARLLINGAPDLAREIQADGVHLGVQTCSITEARNILGPSALIGYSAHSRDEVEMAQQQGADFATFSPIFPTPSKAQYGPPQGLDALRSLCDSSSLPIYALGGIEPERIPEVMAAGSSGVALISAVFAQQDPQFATQSILEKLPTLPTG